ncbi:MAG: ATP-binding cassette domain-containing protein [Pseudomonadota bacterium]|nr:ATP-binding cassette domain-containing protein [Pseudomonadota bacterium]
MGDDGEIGLVLDRVRIVLKARQLLALSITVAPGEIATVMGPSGAGKSALLAFVAGILDPAFVATGEVWLSGRRIDAIAAHLRKTSLLFQDDLLFPHLSVGGNLKFALPSEVKGRAERQSRIEDALAQAGLMGFAKRDPATLSGGQRARVALLRVLLAEPRALLLDEPFSKLDPSLRGQFRQYVFNEARLRMLPVLMVTHDPDDRDAAGGRVVSIGGEA